VNRLLIISVIIILFCNSCLPKKEKADPGKLVITVSILPQKYFIEKLAGDKFKVNVMIPPGASPATYEPTSRQIENISKSNVYFRIGYIEFEQAWMGKIESVNSDMKIYNTARNVTLIQDSEIKHGDHYHSTGIDPHFWMSPKEVKLIVKNILDELCNIDSENASFYRKNYQSFMEEINELDNYVKRNLEKLDQRKFMIFHPSLTYFARDYNLEQISIEVEGKRPTPANLKKLIDEARNNSIKVILIQKQFDRENAVTIGKETGARIVQIDPLDYYWMDQIKDIANKIKQS